MLAINRPRWCLQLTLPPFVSAGASVFVSQTVLKELPRGCKKGYKCTDAAWKYSIAPSAKCTRCRSIHIIDTLPELADLSMLSHEPKRKRAQELQAALQCGSCRTQWGRKEECGRGRVAQKPCPNRRNIGFCKHKSHGGISFTHTHVFFACLFLLSFIPFSVFPPLLLCYSHEHAIVMHLQPRPRRPFSLEATFLHEKQAAPTVHPYLSLS